MRLDRPCQFVFGVKGFTPVYLQLKYMYGSVMVTGKSEAGYFLRKLRIDQPHDIHKYIDCIRTTPCFHTVCVPNLVFWAALAQILILVRLIFIFDDFAHSFCKFHNCIICLVDLLTSYSTVLNLGVPFSWHGDIMLREGSPNISLCFQTVLRRLTSLGCVTIHKKERNIRETNQTMTRKFFQAGISKPEVS